MKKSSGKLARLLVGQARKNMRALSYRPRLETLEERALLSTDTWTGQGGNANWSNSANWSNGVPNAGDDLSFPNLGSNVLVNDLTPGISFNSLSFNGPLTGRLPTIQGNAIVLTGGGISGYSSGANIKLDGITLSADQTFSGWLNVYSPINCNGFGLSLDAYTINYPPPMSPQVLVGTIYGAVYIGRLTGGLSASGPAWSALGPIYLTSNGSISVGTSGPVSLNGFDLTAGASFSGGISGTGNVTIPARAGIGGNNTYTGTTTVLGHLDAFGAITGPINVNGGTLEALGTLTTGPLTFSPMSALSVLFYSLTDYGQVQVNGPIDLTGVFLNPILNFTPPSDSSFVILQSTGSITGTFNGLPDGAILFISGNPFQIHYYNAAGGLPARVVLSNQRQWRDVLTGDFDGDGKPDIVGRDFAGRWWVSLSNGSGFTDAQLWTTWNPNVTWVDVHVGDFNGDGKADIVGRVLETGQWWVALSSGSSFTNQLWDTWNANVTWADVKVGDFDGDGKTDVTGRVLETGQWWTGLSTGSSFNTTLWTTWNASVTWVDVQVGNFSGDGKADIAGRVLETGQWWAGISDGSSFTNSLWITWNASVTWVDVQVGDFNGDGKADIVGRVLETGQWWTAISTGSSFTNSLWTTWNASVTWVDVRVGDFDGDGKADITGRVLETGQWWTAVSNGSSFTNQLWTTWNAGVTWADVQVGDFNGDGKPDIAGRVLETGQWWTATSSGSDFSNNLWTTWPV